MQQKFDINSLRVASPCSVGWETMTGDERVRHCNSCQLNIYNTAEMTTREVDQLIERREGRLCIRLRRRADGTVITRDCPVGLAAVRKRLARSIGAAVSLIFGLAWTGFAQKNVISEPKPVLTESAKTSDGVSMTGLKGVITDQNGSVVPNASISVYKDKPDKRRSVKSDADGTYAFADISDGTYTLEIKANGFNRTIVKNIQVVAGHITETNVGLEVAGESVTMGIFSSDPSIDIVSSTVQTTITLRKISLIPHK